MVACYWAFKRRPCVALLHGPGATQPTQVLNYLYETKGINASIYKFSVETNGNI